MGLGRTKDVTIGATGVGAALATFCLLVGFVVFTAVATRPITARPTAADGIVVLTGGEARIAEAGRLLESGMGRRLLVSGVNRLTSREDLRRLTRLTPNQFDCCVDIGYAALDTFGNADETRVWANQWRFERLIVVTASYHMPRSLTEIALAVPDATLQAHAVVPRDLRGAPWWLRFTAARALISEYFKFIPVATRFAVARISGRRDPDGPAAVLRDAGWPRPNGANTVAARL